MTSINETEPATGEKASSDFTSDTDTETSVESDDVGSSKETESTTARSDQAEDRDTPSKTQNSKKSKDRCRGNSASQERSAHSLRRRPVQGPSRGFQKYPVRYYEADEQYRKRDLTNSEMAQYWYERCSAMMDKNERLLGEITDLNTTAHEDHKRAEKEAKKYVREKERLARLLSSHVRAVNSVSTGLEPVADQNFVGMFKTLHHEVNNWCRNAFTEGESELHPKVDTRTSAQQLLKARVYDDNLPNPFEVIDCIAWAFLETFIFSPWMPALDQQTLGPIDQLQSLIHSADNTSDGEKTAVWRSETASLIFQAPSFQEHLKDVSSISSELIAIIRSAPHAPCFEEQYRGYMEESLRSICTLAAQMRCQRGRFRLDERVTLGALYSEENMEETRGIQVGSGTQAIVSAVLSRGWIRTPPKEVGGAERYICKTRVVVDILPKPEVPVDVE